jgi:predicted ATP-dependent serine protease
MAKTIKVVEEAPKKRGAPSKTCIKCGKTIHARTTNCPHCHEWQPVKEKPPQAEAVTGKKTHTTAVEKLHTENEILKLVVKYGMNELQELMLKLCRFYGDKLTLSEMYTVLVDLEKTID